MTTYDVSEELRALRTKYAKVFKEKIACESEFIVQSTVVTNLKDENEKSKDMLQMALRDVEFQQKRCNELELKLSKLNVSSTTDGSSDSTDDIAVRREEGRSNRATDDQLNPQEEIEYISTKEMKGRINALEESFEAILNSPSKHYNRDRSAVMHQF